MPRLPRGAVRLISDAQAMKHTAKAEPHGDADGLGVYRTIKFDKRTSKWLYPIMLHVDDARVDTINLTDAGYLHVTFSDRPLADFRDPFPLKDASLVAERATAAAPEE